MKKSIWSLLITVFLFSCGEQNNEKKLEELINKRDRLNEEIADLQKSLDAEGNKNGEKIYVVQAETLKPELFRHYIEVQGMVESDNNIFVPAESSGIVKKIHVKSGDPVKQGQLLAELDGAVYERGIDEVKNGLELANTVYERQKRLWDQKIGSEIQYLQAKNTKESLEKKLATLQEQYNMTKITAPISGHVDEIVIKEGEAAAAGFGAIRIVQLSKSKIKASVSDAYIGQIQKNDTALVQVNSINKTFPTVISSISHAIDPNTRTFLIELSIPKDMEQIKPNMMALIRICNYKNNNAITVPINTVQRTGNKYFLFVVAEKNGKYFAEKRFVEPGKYNKNRIEIVSNLKKDEKVITFGFNNLTEGQEIRIN
jgi:membrane fusion protein, multidrug efflux system